MFKYKSVIAACAMMLLTNTSAFSNPYEDVPSNHWAYQAINELSEAGVITCINGNVYNGSKSIDRLTMASYLANALSNIENKFGKDYSKLGEKNVSNIQRLAMEYADELAIMAVKYNGLDTDMQVVKEDVANLKWDVAEIKKNIEESPKDKVIIGGDYLTRFTDLHYKHDFSGVHQAAGLFRLKFTMNIDENVKAVARWRLLNGLGNSGTWIGQNHQTGIMDLAFLQINNKLGGDFLLGRTFEATGHSLLINNYVDVARYTTHKGQNTIQLNAYFNRENTKDDHQVWNINFKRNNKSYYYYVNFYGQTTSNGYDIINHCDNNLINDSNRYDIEIGAHGLLGNSGKYTYDFSAVHTSLKQDLTDNSKVRDDGNIVYGSLNWDSKEEVAAKISCYVADTEAHGGLFLGGDRRLAMGPESPLEDIARLDNLTGVQNNFFINGDAKARYGFVNTDTRNFVDTKIQFEYRPKNSSKNYFRVAYDFLREYKEKVNGFDNLNPLGTDSGKADVLTVEYRYKFNKNTNWKSGFTRFSYKGFEDEILGQDAGYGFNGRDKDYHIFWSEIYTHF